MPSALETLGLKWKKSEIVFHMGQQMFVNVVLPLALPRLYTYSVPAEFCEEMAVGKRVAVQFGKKKVYAAIVHTVHNVPPENYETKSILQVIDNKALVSPVQFRFWEWMAQYYMCSLGDVMKAALPSGLKMESETLVTANNELEFDDVDLTASEALVFDTIRTKGSQTVEQLSATINVKNPIAVIKSMLDKGIISVQEELQMAYKPRTETYVRFHRNIKTDADVNALFELLKRAEAQQRIVMAFLALTVPNGNTFSGWVKRKDLLEKAQVSPSSLTSLIEKFVFEVEIQEVSRLKLSNENEFGSVELSPAQFVAYNSIQSQLGERGVVLLHGVTSSGKTEIYIKLIAEQLEQGRQVLYILPEIALTTQIITRLKSFFGNRVGVYHSKFSDGQRVEIYNGLLSNGSCSHLASYDVVLGVRSSIFLPFQRLGLVIVDEEHENTLKQFNPAPRYHARDAAIVLASMHSAKVLLGTATPSVETYYNAQTGKYGLVTLTERFGKVNLPTIEVVDTLTARKKKLMKSIFAPQLVAAIDQSLQRGEQIILFQNRRGYSPYVECDECAWIPQCKHCAVTLTYHKKANQLVCHYCGFTADQPSTCLACGSPRLAFRGFGTEKVEDELGLLFPTVRVGRMDLDTTRSRSSYERIIGEFEDGALDILVGTQMVTKGLDFDRVGLVGILNADSMLNFPDFRAYERSFQLMTQVAGRAGRRNQEGRVLVQTANPNHPVVKQVVSTDFEGLFRSQLAERQQYLYPPYCRLIRLTLKHRNAQLLETASVSLGNSLRSFLQHRVLGPEEPIIGKIQEYFIRDIIIKLGRDVNLSAAKEHISKHIEKMLDYKPFAAVIVSIDVDPY